MCACELEQTALFVLGDIHRENSSPWVIQFCLEIRLKKLNVSLTLYCNVLTLTVYFIGKLMY